MASVRAPPWLCIPCSCVASYTYLYIWHMLGSCHAPRHGDPLPSLPPRRPIRRPRFSTPPLEGV
eukprot:3468947-Pyramimonas_sp.AAC.1